MTHSSPASPSLPLPLSTPKPPIGMGLAKARSAFLGCTQLSLTHTPATTIILSALPGSSHHLPTGPLLRHLSILYSSMLSEDTTIFVFPLTLLYDAFVLSSQPVHPHVLPSLCTQVVFTGTLLMQRCETKSELCSSLVWSLVVMPHPRVEAAPLLCSRQLLLQPTGQTPRIPKDKAPMCQRPGVTAQCRRTWTPSENRSVSIAPSFPRSCS